MVYKVTRISAWVICSCGRNVPLPTASAVPHFQGEKKYCTFYIHVSSFLPSYNNGVINIIMENEGHTFFSNLKIKTISNYSNINNS